MTSSEVGFKRLARYLQRLMLCLSLIVLGWLAWLHRLEIIEVLRNFPFHFLCLILLYVIGIGVQAASFSLMFPLKVRKSFVGLYDAWGRTTLFGYVAPFFPSILMRALYFRKWGVGFNAYLAVTMRWALTGIYVAFLVGVAATCSLYLRNSWWLLIFFALAVIGAYAYKKFSEALIKLFASRIASAAEADNAGVCLVLRRVLLVSVQYFVVAICYFIAFDMMEVDLPFAVSVLMGVAIIIAALIPLFANGIGLAELCMGYVANDAGADLGGIVAGLIYLRIAHALACLVLIGISWSVRNFGGRAGVGGRRES